MAKNNNTNTDHVADYEAKIVSTSRELTVRERIKIKDTTGSITFDKATDEGEIVIKPDYWASISIHNEKSKREDKDYLNYVVVDKDGTIYSTGSESFWNSFINIVDELIEAGETDFDIRVYKLPSKNFQGKDYITCSLV